MDEQAATAALRELGRILKKARQHAGLRQEDAAEWLAQSGFRLSTDSGVSSHETGRTLVPAGVLAAYIQRYGMSAKEAERARTLRKALADARDDGAWGGGSRRSRFFYGPGGDPGTRGGLPVPGVPVPPPVGDVQRGAGERDASRHRQLGSDERAAFATKSDLAGLSAKVDRILRHLGLAAIAAIAFGMATPTPAEAAGPMRAPSVEIRDILSNTRRRRRIGRWWSRYRREPRRLCRVARERRVRA